MPTAKELREKLGAKQDELGKVFSEAKTDDGSLDFNNVKCLGNEVKGSVAVAEKVGQMNAELEDIAKQAEAIESAEKAASDHDAREKDVRRPQQPTGAKEARRERAKSLGELVLSEKEYREWAESGAPGGRSFQFRDVAPSDILAKGAQFDTLQSKALFETSAGWAPESLRIPGFVEDTTRPVQLIDVMPLSQTGFDQIVYMEETTRTHSASETAEGAAFKESTFDLSEKTSPVRKITDSVPVTDEQLEDVAQANSYLNSRVTFGLRQRLDSQILVGNGTNPNLTGLKNIAGIQSQPKGTDPVPDAVFKAMTNIRLVGRAQPTHIMMHPTDWQGIRLLRTSDGVYIWGSPSESGPERMWGLPIVQQDADAAGTAYVGSFQPSWISLFERRGVDVQVGFTGTQFTEGKRTIRADMRMAFVVFRPNAFSTVTGL